jgi:hypothetical protein
MPDGTATTPRATRSRLKGTTPELIRPRKPKILVFGGAGYRKTSWAISWPGSYMIDAEGGATQPEYIEKMRASGASYLGPDEGAGSFETVMDQVRALATERHDRRTLIIDSATKLFANEVAREAERLANARKKNEFSADKKPAIAYMRQLCWWLQRIDMNVILICGETSEWAKVEGGDREQVGATFDLGWPRLEYELDLAVQVIKAGPRYLGKVRKSRLAAFPQTSTFDWTYEAFVEKYGRDVIEQQSVPITFATTEQLAEIERLLEIVKLPDGTVDKWLADANVSGWNEISQERAGKAIEYLRGRIAA